MLSAYVQSLEQRGVQMQKPKENKFSIDVDF
jgi:hypothetical protein